ncbi:MAG: Rdx family protein [Gemmatimonadetes bacterium]|nr:Rdx family protein [Gemmatimonadota bacterium]
MAATLEARFPGAAVELKSSGGGRFEVVADGRLVYSKAATGRHPTHEEVIEAIVDRRVTTVPETTAECGVRCCCREKVRCCRNRDQGGEADECCTEGTCCEAAGDDPGPEDD